MRSRHRNIYEKYGEVFFVTFSIVGHINIFNDPSCCEIVIEKLKFYQERGDFVMLAYAIMPNHVHLILKTHVNHTISSCIGNLKRITSRELTRYLKSKDNIVFINRLDKAAKKEPAKDCRIWKPRFDCLVINNFDTLTQKIQYIHNNPVKAGLVDNAAQWPYSSAVAYEGVNQKGLIVDINWESLGWAKERSGRDS